MGLGLVRRRDVSGCGNNEGSEPLVRFSRKCETFGCVFKVLRLSGYGVEGGCGVTSMRFDADGWQEYGAETI